MRIVLNILLGIGFSLLPILLSAKTLVLPKKDALVSRAKYLVAVNDTIPAQKQDDKKNKEQPKDAKQVGKNVEPEIKQVPKARRQVKPTIIKPSIKVKPIKIVRPKIKKP